MSAAEQDVLNRLMQLDVHARRRVIHLAEQSLEPALSEMEWLNQADQLRAKLAERHGPLQFSIVDLIHEVREERTNDLMDRY
jgi:hypothetical protein